MRKRTEIIKADPDGALGKSFSTVYNDLKNAEEEDAKETASPAWMNGITYANIETVAVMAKDNTNIIVTGDSSPRALMNLRFTTPDRTPGTERTIRPSPIRPTV